VRHAVWLTASRSRRSKLNPRVPLKRTGVRMIRKGCAALALVMSLSGCSTVMEANRPDPVDLAQFTPAERRVEVIGHLGPPKTTVADGDASCDAYALYTRGVSRVGKGAIILGEAAADVFTLGLSEVAFTPGEAATKNRLHSVLFCYGPDNLLRSVADNGRVIVGVTNPAAPGSQTQPPSAAPSP
jgi:hypothetical protein